MHVNYLDIRKSNVPDYCRQLFTDSGKNIMSTFYLEPVCYIVITVLRRFHSEFNQTYGIMFACKTLNIIKFIKLNKSSLEISFVKCEGSLLLQKNHTNFQPTLSHIFFQFPSLILLIHE